MLSNKNSTKYLSNLGSMLNSLLERCVQDDTPLTKSGIKLYLSTNTPTSYDNLFRLRSMLHSVPFIKHVNSIDEVISINKQSKLTLLTYSKIDSYPSEKTTSEIVSDFDNVVRNSEITVNHVAFFATIQAVIYFAVYSGDRDLVCLISYIYLLFSKEV